MEYNIICLPSWWREGEEGVSKLGYPPIKIVWLANCLVGINLEHEHRCDFQLSPRVSTGTY